MDKLTLISGTLFMAADIFAIVSLAMPDWIITDVGGEILQVIQQIFVYVNSRGHKTGTNVDMYDTVQSSPSMFHS
ncbi:unnamed protein product [Callosobruchus maculatus]|uniref:Uncharacterized protein n=1 Tax=Callosobruchus maculatus TaxID=64391 RepID=A0A653CAG5_CALMS|nr:unnamed protein product [Callosobruchus maculatus]